MRDLKSNLVDIPSDWEIGTLRNVTIKFLNGGTPSTSNNQYWNGNIPWITGTDVTNTFLLPNRRFITELGLKNSSTNLVPKGSILVVTRTGVGKISLAECDVAISQDLTGVVIDENKGNSIFYLWYLKYNAPIYISIAQGTTIGGILRKDVEKTPIPIPPLPEQQKIAEILSTVDDAIEKTDAIIKETQQLKIGLMQKLFTEGIGHTRFKETKIGKIPEEWEIVSLNYNFEVIDGDRGINYPKSSEFKTQGHCLFLNAKNVTKNGFNFEVCFFVSKERDMLLNKGKLNRRDIVLTTRGTIGNLAYYNEDVNFEHLRINSGMVILRPKTNKINVKFYYRFFQSDFLQKQIQRITFGTAQPQLTVKDINKINLIKCSTEEEKDISHIIESIHQKLDNEENTKRELVKLKKGLMQILLTGKKRVKI